MRQYTDAELRLLNRLAISPHLRQVDLARELQITRSAVNQVWSELERECNLRIRSQIDFHALGMRHIAGWATDDEPSSAFGKFKNWLTSNPFVVSSQESLMTSSMDHRIVFEVVAPEGMHLSHVTRQLERFTKRPYELDITYDLVKGESVHFNLGLFDGKNWNFEGGYRLGATISAAKDYVDILPSYSSKPKFTSEELDFLDIVIALSLHNNYHVSSLHLKSFAKSIGVSTPTARTFRRRLEKLRETIAHPYLSLQNIGLSTPFTLCLRRNEGDHLPRLMHAQAASLPKSRILSGNRFVIMLLEIPASIDWIALSQIFSEMVGLSTKMCTFIAKDYPHRLVIEELLIRLMSSAPHP